MQLRSCKQKKSMLLTTTGVRSSKSKAFKQRRGNTKLVRNFRNFDQEPTLFVALPPETFAVICAHLPPVDLHSLSRACRRFRGFLWSTTSAVTDSIWRTSRTTFLRHPISPPPVGLAEMEYLRLVLEKGCMFCDRKDNLQIYWEFQVRCCGTCLELISIRDYHLTSRLKRMNISQDIISGLPFLLRCNTPKYDGKVYLLADIQRVREDYDTASDKELWVLQKSEEILAFLQDARERTKDTQTNQKICIMIERGRRYKVISAKIKELAKQLRNSKTSIGQTEYLLKRCPSYRRVVDVPKPFTERSWAALVKKLEIELPKARRLSQGTLPSNDEISEIREELRERVRRLQARLAETFDESY
ncbi:hypothetical protein G9A89_016123 [Geosiphon pyriformis]|nr:hypothetical protein G9A89_016123 [Geosiphon pyriformis]